MVQTHYMSCLWKQNALLIGRTVYQIDLIKHIKLSKLCTNNVNQTAER